jgi:hypothetical protein
MARAHDPKRFKEISCGNRFNQNIFKKKRDGGFQCPTKI